jgi:hypothetical protein
MQRSFHIDAFFFDTPNEGEREQAFTHVYPRSWLALSLSLTHSLSLDENKQYLMGLFPVS